MNKKTKLYKKDVKMKKGFTLGEVMVVIIILGIFAAIVFPVYNRIIRRTSFKEVARKVDLVRAAAKYYGLKYGISNLPTDDTAWDFLQVDNDDLNSYTDLVYAIVSSGGDPALQVSYGGPTLYTYNLVTKIGSVTADSNVKYLPDNLPLN